MEKLNKFVSFGNKKIPKSTIIFNLGSATNCPSKKLGLCKVSNICYAYKAERQYPAVKPYRDRQEEYYRLEYPNSILNMFLSVIAWKSKSKYPIKAIRFSEAGDFESQHMVDKMTSIFRRIKKEHPKLNIYGYTARKDLNFKEMMKFATVQGSNFMLSNNFVPVKEVNKKNPYCAADCRKCFLCQENNNKIIQVKIH